MFKQTVTYEDFDGNMREEECMFSLKQTELIELDKNYYGGIQGELSRIAASQNRSGMVAILQDIVLAAYGQKSMDGRRFMKDPEATQAFKESIAFDEVVMDIVSDPTGEKLSKFISGVLPAKLAAEASQMLASKNATVTAISDN